MENQQLPNSGKQLSVNSWFSICLKILAGGIIGFAFAAMLDFISPITVEMIIVGALAVLGFYKFRKSYK